MTKNLLSAVVLLLALIGVPRNAGAMQRVDRQLPASPGETLFVRLESGGSIRVLGSGSSQVEIEAEFSGRDQDNIQIDIERVSSGVEIRSSFREKRSRNETGGKITVRVPSNFDLDLRTNGGEIRIDGVTGTIHGETMGGEIDLVNLNGELDLTTMGGNVRLEDSSASGRLKTMGGTVTLRNVCGSVGAETLGGNVVYDNVDDSCGGTCREVRISTMGGNIDAPDAPCGADLETMGGNIRIERVGEFVKASTMGGNIFIGAVDGGVRATTMGGSIDVTMVGSPGQGRRDVRLESKGGDITLTLPDGLSMEIEVTLALTKQGLQKQKYSIESDFPLDIRRTDTWDFSEGSARKYVRGKATVGSGANKIRIETTDGDVRIVRR